MSFLFLDMSHEKKDSTQEGRTSRVQVERDRETQRERERESERIFREGSQCETASELQDSCSY